MARVREGTRPMPQRVKNRTFGFYLMESCGFHRGVFPARCCIRWQARARREQSVSSDRLPVAGLGLLPGSPGGPYGPNRGHSGDGRSQPGSAPSLVAKTGVRRLLAARAFAGSIGTGTESLPPLLLLVEKVKKSQILDLALIYFSARSEGANFHAVGRQTSGRVGRAAQHRSRRICG